MMYQPPFMRGPGGPPAAPQRPGVPRQRVIPPGDQLMTIQPVPEPNQSVMPVPGPRVPSAGEFMPPQPKTGSAPVQMLAQKMARRPVKRGMTGFGA